jgi:RNA polymerase sigma factor for flagellar operon FliA
MNVYAAYSTTDSLTEEEVVQRFADLVKRIAYHIAGRLPSNIQIEDLIQAGLIGLLEAARNYRVSRGASFETYASTRIRGAMLDEVRRCDWTPRSVHRKAREATEAMRMIENREGREARDTEVAQALGISLEAYHQILTDSVNSRLLYLDDSDTGADPNRASAVEASARAPSLQEQLESDRFRESLVAEIERLPEREKLVMSLYYQEELNLREIGSVLGVSESRVCQIHGQALMRLRARLLDWLESDR